MTLIPLLFRDMEHLLRPTSRTMDLFGNHFPENLLMAFNYVPAINRNNVVANRNSGDFQVRVDCQQFAPEEISVKMTDNYITIEGKHEEKQDEHGYISRQFVRKYQLPEGYDKEKVQSSLSSDGVLTIKAPMLPLPESKGAERTIPIMKTGKPAKEIQSNAAADKQEQAGK